MTRGHYIIFVTSANHKSHRKTCDWCVSTPTIVGNTASLPDAYSKLLFRMSSPLPEHLVRFAQEKGFKVSMESRGFMFNADAVEIVEFFDIGTRAAQLR